MQSNAGVKSTGKSRGLEGVIFLVVCVGGFGYIGSVMGITNMANTIMNTAHKLLLDTVLYLMGVTVIAGAVGKLLIEFGVVSLLEVMLAPLMRPLFGLPGVASLAGLMTFFSDNPAIIGLAHDKGYRRNFKKHELISLSNFGTAFGMGLIVITYMATLKIKGAEGNFLIPALLGLAGAVFGAVISTRIMQKLIKPYFAGEEDFSDTEDFDPVAEKGEEEEHKGVFLRLLDAMLDGGKSGVDMGLAIIPGVLIISTFIMILTFGPSGANGEYAGKAFEGVALLPMIGDLFSGVFSVLFGFESPELIAFPITSLGAVGAAMSLVPKFADQGVLITGNEIAVFTAMGMCWSGYLSTHTAMLDTLGYRKATSKAIIAHTVGGLCAGIFAHFAYVIFF